MQVAGKNPRCGQLAFALFFVLFTPGVYGLAQLSEPTIAREVRVLVTVITKQGRIPRGLSADAFVVEEEGKQCTVSKAVFGDRPAAVVLLFDISGSMTGPRNYNWRTNPRYTADPVWDASRLREAARTFIAAGHSDNHYLTIAAGEKAQILHDFTRDSGEVLKPLNVRLFGKTALFDALVEAANQLERTQAPTKAVILISDGEDNVSRASEKDAERALVRAGASLCTLYCPDEVGFGGTLVRRLVEATGGGALQERRSDITPPMAVFARALRYRYALFYTPPAHPQAKDAYDLKIKVREEIVGKGCNLLAVRSRSGR